ncbi:hypothetical protein [Paenibacillus tyrfis]|uniref:hypothetical protein n=1 Tax=Paenibacillus tyrfis TaxID=1501230 RepID=UPI0020A08757|nr:hypothetical protein [Paenibacillus tyrfis]MCP1309149.1 hypothetical protein [Paenibacillus tyrfis]
MRVHHLMEDIVRGCLKELMQGRKHLADLSETRKATRRLLPWTGFRPSTSRRIKCCHF